MVMNNWIAVLKDEVSKNHIERKLEDTLVLKSKLKCRQAIVNREL